MSARIPVLFSTTAAALALTAGMAGSALAAPPPGDPASVKAPEVAPPASSVSSTSSSTSSASSSSSAKDGTDLAACMDATCEVQVRDGQKIPLDRKYGLKPVEVDVRGNRAIFTLEDARNPKTKTVMDVAGGDSSATYNGITFRPRMTKDGNVIVDVSHA
ncbi:MULTISPECIES: hypothetical protein [Actinomadura]|uniref:Secreted protein n=1 Tax=Actinomadura madurae TaxID=1993 RepID=A0A1I5C2J0_9ACTN|nr:hypothetical protein [Actinomadura madurae]SFN81106.1 hypothetical protein SAMN04489713_103117 [Actinomadura madurae]SPT50843.1 Uncharacterised protein [Actinomadura madurae]